MNEPFDPYYTWLGISPKERPLDVYRFLGLPRFESDTVVIESAADQRMAHVRAFQTGPRGEVAAQILNELAAARVVLLNPQKKAAYDQRLRSTDPSAPPSQTTLARVATPSSALLDPTAPNLPEVSTPNRRSRLIAIVGGSVVATALLMAVIVYSMSNNNPTQENDKSVQTGTAVANTSPAGDTSSAPNDIKPHVGTSGQPTAVAISPKPESHSVEPSAAPTDKPASTPQRVAVVSSPAADTAAAEQTNATPAPTEAGSPSPAVSAPEAPVATASQPHAVPLDSTNAPLASAALAVFQEECYRCHGRNGSNEGGLNFILQSDKLIAKGYIMPGDASASRLYKRLVAGTMPPGSEQPRPTLDQTASIKKWIETGAPQLMAPPANRAWITNAEIVKAIYDDVERQDSADRRFLRYFTLTHLYNAGLSDDELQSYRLGFSKLVNSLSWGAKIVVPQSIDAAQTILRVDLRDIKWTEQTWDAIVAQNPYSFLADTSQSRDLAHLTRTELPFVRTDWFVAAASVPPLYY